MATALHRIYVYAEQVVAARAALDECGLAFERQRLQRVSTRHHLMGLSCGTFIVVRNHPSPVPADIWQEVERLGMIVMTVDDTFIRTKATAAA